MKLPPTQNRRLISAITLGLYTCLTFILPVYAQTIHVGIFENPPIMRLNGNNPPSGLAIEVIEEIGKQENWKIVYVKGTQEELLTELSKKRINLLVGIPYTNEVKNRFRFTSETLINDWGIVYRNPAINIDSIFDLKAKRVAVKKGSPYSVRFGDMLAQFGIDYQIIESNSYDEVLKAVNQGMAEAGIVGRLYGMQNIQYYNLLETTIVFNPVDIRFAAPLNADSNNLTKIDFHLVYVKTDPNSYFHAAIKSWINIVERKRFPLWVIWIFLATVIATLATFAFNWYLRSEVKKRTSALSDSELRFRQ